MAQWEPVQDSWGSSEEQEVVSSLTRPRDLTVPPPGRRYFPRMSSSDSSSSTRSSHSYSSLHSQESQPASEGCDTADIPLGMEGMGDLTVGEEKEEETEKVILQAMKAGKLLQDLADRDGTYTGMELVGMKMLDGIGRGTVETFGEIFSPIKGTPREDERPVLIGTATTPDEGPLNVFFGKDYKWRACDVVEKDGGGLTKLRKLKRGGSSPCILKSEAQVWNLRIQNNCLFLLRNGAPYREVNGVQVVRKEGTESEVFKWQSGLKVELKHVFSRNEPGTVLGISPQPKGPDVEPYSPGSDNPDCVISEGKVGPKGTPTPDSLRHSVLLFSKAAYLALSYPEGPDAAPETATLVGLSEEHLISKLESERDDANAGFMPLINIRSTDDGKIALFFNTAQYHYYLHPQGDKLMLQPVKICKKESPADWVRHAYFVVTYQNAGLVIGCGMAATGGASPNPTRLETDSHDQPDGTLSGSPPVQKQRLPNTPNTPDKLPDWSAGHGLPDTPNPSDDVPDWPTDHYSGVVSNEGGGENGMSEKGAQVKCRESKEVHV